MDAPARPPTLASWLIDNVPVPPDTAARLLALEGEQPSLDEMRRALGFGLDLSRVWAAYEAAAPDFAQPQTDGQLAALIDALYAAIDGTLAVRATVDAAAVSVSREHGAIVMREGERLALLCIVKNETPADAEFSIEARGAGTGRIVAAGRTATLLLEAGPLPAGSYLLAAMAVADGRPATLDVPVECSAAGRLSVRISDEETGERVAARVYCADALAPLAPAGTALRRDRDGNEWFHADGGFEAIASGRVRLRVVRGIEYQPAEFDVNVRADANESVDVRLRRWSHMAVDGWRSGDVHVHMHYGGELAMTPADAALAQRAEDVHFMHMMVANCNDGGTLMDAEHFTGAPHELSHGDHILRWGEEYRNALYGHMCLVGIPSLVEPVFTGVPFSTHDHDWPPNAAIASSAREIDGTVTYAHPLLYGGGLDLDRVFGEPRNVEAKELPVDAALGRIDAVDILSYPGSNAAVTELWYRLLNCGLKLAATAGTDAFMNVVDSTELLAFDTRAFSNPPGGQRAFVRIEGEFTGESWCAGVRRGETFVTNGPMIDFNVDGARIGSELRVERGATVRIEASAGSWLPMQRLEIVTNGEVVASAEATYEGRFAHVEHELRIDESCWIAARVVGDAHELVMDESLYAHTSPIYVLAHGAPIARPDDAAYFVAWIDRLIETVRAHGRFASDEQREDVVATFREGQRYYRAAGGA
ncbi:MAG TPA: CehA/McbA family metallohydrolase [Dehalococcoidia bacterium]|nr:CehA/McbA family metallohydrolase [Dehalococcoidia bacterium]